MVKAKVYGNTYGKKTQVLLAICSEGKLETGKILMTFNQLQRDEGQNQWGQWKLGEVRCQTLQRKILRPNVCWEEKKSTSGVVTIVFYRDDQLGTLYPPQSSSAT